MSYEGQTFQVLEKVEDGGLVYYTTAPISRTGPIVTLAGLTLGLLGGIVLGYMLHMAVHGV